MIGNGTASSAQVVFIDAVRRAASKRGMAVVTPDGIVGKIIAVYPLASQVLLVTDPTFAVGVESQKEHIHGTLQCNGSNCQVKYIQNEEKVDRGRMVLYLRRRSYFPERIPRGQGCSHEFGTGMKEINLNLSGAPGGADEVLVVIEGAHQQIPTTPPQQRLAKMSAAAAERCPGRSASAENGHSGGQDQGAVRGHREGARVTVTGLSARTLPNFNAAAPPQPEPAGSRNAAKGPGKRQDQGSGRRAGEFRRGTTGRTSKSRKTCLLGAADSGSPASAAPATGAQNPVVQKPKPAVEGPVLPLGAPRKKTRRPGSLRTAIPQP